MKRVFRYAAALWLAMAGGCSSPPKPSEPVLRRMAPGQEFSGFLSDYSKLKPSPKFEGRTLSYVLGDPARNIQQYVAIIVDPVEVYLATDADETKVPDQGRTALAEYFRRALVQSVSSAFPVVQEPGALVLRLRSALIGVDIGGEVPYSARAADPDAALSRMMNIGKVGVEMEVLNVETGEQVAAAVDRKPLGDGIVFGSVNFTRDENFRAARRALDAWAARVREFLDTANGAGGTAAR